MEKSKRPMLVNIIIVIMALGLLSSMSLPLSQLMNTGSLGLPHGSNVFWIYQLLVNVVLVVALVFLHKLNKKSLYAYGLYLALAGAGTLYYVMYGGSGV